jgi:hypothetical protein
MTSQPKNSSNVSSSSSDPNRNLLLSATMKTCARGLSLHLRVHTGKSSFVPCDVLAVKVGVISSCHWSSFTLLITPDSACLVVAVRLHIVTAVVVATTERNSDLLGNLYCSLTPEIRALFHSVIVQSAAWIVFSWIRSNSSLTSWIPAGVSNTQRHLPVGREHC